MSDHDDLIAKFREEIQRCKVGKLDSRKEHDMGNMPLAALNTRLAEYDKRIAEAEAELKALQPEEVTPPDKPLPTATPDERWDVFISYQRESETEAKEVNKRLTATGLRVWQDVNNIRHTTRWSQIIDGALRNTDRLILLMTPAAMQSHEVFNEWFYFYNTKKPIHCLMLQTCDPHYQLLPYQYLDWRETDKCDWERLIREVRADFTQPTAITPSPIVSAPQTDQEALSESPFADLLEAAREPHGSIALTPHQIKQLAGHKPSDIAEYRLGRVAEWSQSRYALDNRFVNLTLLLDKGEEAQLR